MPIPSEDYHHKVLSEIPVLFIMTDFFVNWLILNSHTITRCKRLADVGYAAGVTDIKRGILKRNGAETERGSEGRGWSQMYNSYPKCYKELGNIPNINM